jgi:hypothetical protein
MVGWLVENVYATKGEEEEIGLLSSHRLFRVDSSMLCPIMATFISFERAHHDELWVW